MTTHRRTAALWLEASLARRWWWDALKQACYGSGLLDPFS